LRGRTMESRHPSEPPKAGEPEMVTHTGSGKQAENSKKKAVTRRGFKRAMGKKMRGHRTCGGLEERGRKKRVPLHGEVERRDAGTSTTRKGAGTPAGGEAIDVEGEQGRPGEAGEKQGVAPMEQEISVRRNNRH